MKRFELIHKMSRNELAEYIAKSFEIRPRLKQCRGCQECYNTMGDNSEALIAKWIDEEVLLPCPFCESFARLERDIEGGYEVWCVDCGANIKTSSVISALRLWNRRGNDAQKGTGDTK